MNTHIRLPVLQTVKDVFTFTFKKYPSLLVLSFAAAVVTEPLTFLCLQFTSTFKSVVSLGRYISSTDRFIESLPASGLGLLIILMAVLLFLALVAVPIIRHITHGERLWLIRINSSTFDYMLCQSPVLIILVTIGGYVSMSASTVGAVFTNASEEICATVFLLWSPVIIALAYIGVRCSLIPVTAVASGSIDIRHAFSLSRNNGFRILMIVLLIGVPILFAGLAAMYAVLQLYSIDQGPLAIVGEVDAINIFNGGPGQILALYVYIFSKPVFIAANTIVFLFLAIATGSLLGTPAIIYHKLRPSNGVRV